MSEIFKNFISVSKTVGEKIIVPSAEAGNNTVNILAGSTSMGQLLREENSTAQVHSLYITQASNPRIKGDNRYDESVFKHIDLIIKDVDNSDTKVYIAYDVQIVPGAPYYIEKNITLIPSQYLVIDIPSGAGQNNTDLNINVSASTILFVDD
jgi:asparagine synthetase A